MMENREYLKPDNKLLFEDATLEERLRNTLEEQRNFRNTGYKIRESLLPVAEEMEIRSKVNAESHTYSLLDKFLSGQSVYAIGDGGIGKTTTLFRAAEKLVSEERCQIPVYVELNRLPMWKKESGMNPREYWLGNEGRPMFLEQYIAGIYYGCPGRSTGKMDLVAGALKRQIEQKEGKDPKYLLLLDGLNEIAFSGNEDKNAFMEALNWYLKFGRNIRIILTSRYDEALIDSDKIQRVRVNGLTEDSVLRCLQEEITAGNLTLQEYEEIEMMERSSTLWKCLKLPLFLMMYCQVEQKQKVKSVGEILKQFFHGKRINVDGTRGYTERALATEKYQERLFAPGISMEIARQLFIDLLLPKFGFDMAKKQIFFVERKRAEAMFSDYINGTWTGGVNRSEGAIKRYGYTFDVEIAMKRLAEAGTERILEYICENMGLLARSGEESYFFPHQYYRDYFAAAEILLEFETAVELKEDKEADKILDFLEQLILSDRIWKLCGECLGIHRTVPEFDGSRWTQTEQWDPLFDAVLNLRRKRHSSSLIRMLRLCRKYGERADLSGIDFSNIILSGGDFSNVIFSHPAGNKGIYANLRGTELSDIDFQFGITTKRQRMESYIMAPNDTWMLTIKSYGDAVLLEEREVLGDEIRPMGYWGKLSHIQYREDGQILAIVEEKKDTMGAWPMNILYFYDCMTGRKISAPIGRGRLLDMQWIGKSLVVIRENEDCGFVRHIARDEGNQLLLEERELCETRKDLTAPVSIIDVDRILIKYLDYAVIYQYETENTIWLDIPGPMLLHAIVDHRNGKAYIVNSEGQVFCANIENGSTELIHEAEIFSRISRMFFAGEKVYFCADKCFYQTDTKFRNIRLITMMSQNQETVEENHRWYYESEDNAESAEQTTNISVGGKYAVRENGDIFRISDGVIISYRNERKEKKCSGRYFWISPRSEVNRVSILDVADNILYHYKIAEDKSMERSGYTFMDLDDEPVHAIYVDHQKQLLFVCGQDKIRHYGLHSGKRVKSIPDINLRDMILNLNNVLSIEESYTDFYISKADFTPDGKCLELSVVLARRNKLSILSKRVLCKLDYRTGSIEVRPNEDQGNRISQYCFEPEDILSGMDSGTRYPDYEMVSDMSKYEILEEWEYREQNKLLETPKWLKKALRSIRTKWNGNGKNQIRIPLFHHGSNCGGLGDEGLLYWNEKKGKLFLMPIVPFISEYSEKLPYLEYKYIPFDDGFLAVNGLELIRYVAGEKLEQYEYSSYFEQKYFFLGCPGSEEINDIKLFRP